MPRKKRYVPQKEVQPESDGDDNYSFDDDTDDEDDIDETNSVDLNYHGVDFRSDDEKEEVLPVVDDDDDGDDDDGDYNDEEGEDENEEFENSDLEDKNEDNKEAWGKKKSMYFSADFVDEDRGRSYREEDKEAAKAEEDDALEIQRKFLDAIHSTAYETKQFTVDEPIPEESGTIASIDWQSINRKEKFKVVSQASPEFLSSMQEFKKKLIQLKQQIPQLLDDIKTSNGKKNKYLKLKSQILLHYAMNMSFYMVLKSMNKPVLHHPVLKKIKAFENILNQFENLNVKDQSLLKSAKMNFKACDGIASKIQSGAKGKQTKDAITHEKFENQDDVEMEETAEDSAIQEKRSVPYKIAKNKGLTPHRKKEYRNPRVRHRMKFKKALIRRKGQVRNPRTETQRYGGEHTGIHAYVTKSVKFK